MDDVTRLVGEELARLWPDMTIYSENQSDGFVEPSFYVHRIGLNVSPNYFGYQLRKYSFQVIYFPGDEDTHQKLDTMAEAWAANFRTISDFAHVENQEINIEDEALAMTFDLNIRAKPDIVVNKLRNLDYSGGIKHGR